MEQQADEMFDMIVIYLKDGWRLCSVGEKWSM
jgi:hypothetical protein